MPYTVNGIGTWYFGRKTLYRHRGVCGKCGKDSYLSSYDTTSYFVFLFLPLIPLGKKRVLDECSSCKSHKVIPLRQWHEIKNKTLEETKKKYRDNPEDSDGVREVLLTVLEFGDREKFLELAYEIEDNVNDDAEVFYILGAGYYDFGLYEQAEKTIAASLSIKDDQETRELLSSVLIRQLRPAEAEKYIGHVITQQLKEKAGLLIYLAKSYQAVGEHQKALEKLDEALVLEPEIKKNKDYKKTRTISQKNIYSKTAILSPDISSPSVEIKGERNFSAKIAPYVGPVVLLAFILGYMTLCFAKGFNTKVYFVNGLSKSYDIEVDERLNSLRPKTAKSIRVGEGTVKVKIKGNWPKISEQRYKIRTNFFTRLFADKTFVINPDETALLFWERTYYSARPQNAPAGEATIHNGESFYVFDNIDYVFKAFPSEIEVSENKAIPKERVDLMDEVGMESLTNALAQYKSKEAVIEYLKKYLLHEPEKTEHLYMLYYMLGPSEFVETIRDGLDVRPIRIGWHRMYQEAMESSDPNHDLTAEYKEFLEKEPENNSLYYLVGRVLTDQNESEKYFLKSVEDDNPCAYGYGALGFDRLSCGRFDEAVKLYAKAKRIDSERYDFRYYYFASLKAARMYDEALNECRNFIKEAPYDFTWSKEEWELLLAMGEYEKAQRQADRWIKNAEQVYGIEWIETTKQTLPVMFAYYKGNREEYVALCSVNMDPNDKFYVALNSRKPVADEVLPKEELDGYTCLVLYISQKQYGSDEKAEEFLAKAITQLNGGGKEEKFFADCLASKIKPDPNQVCNEAMDPGKKRILLTAMGFRYPQHRKVYFGLAEKLNFYRIYPYLFLKTIFEESTR